MTKSAFIAIVGCPNVGKSSILNHLLGTKIAIVSDKPQTTRTRIMGVLTEDDTQLVFTDTPGFHRPRNKLGEKMVQAVSDSVAGVDACLFVVEPQGEIRTAELELVEKFRQQKMPVILAINKVDTLPDKEVLMARIAELTKLYDFTAVVPVSALRGINMNALLDELKALAEESVFFFPEDTLTDQPERVIAAEIIREKLLLFYQKEIPYSCEVAVESYEEKEGVDNIRAVIFVERESQKAILIGHKGMSIKKVGIEARKDIEEFTGKKCFLNLYIKVLKDWRNSDKALKQFGYEME